VFTYNPSTREAEEDYEFKASLDYKERPHQEGRKKGREGGREGGRKERRNEGRKKIDLSNLSFSSDILL
jgi:hypothetical protein